MNAIENGARQAVVNCIKVKPTDSVVIITDQHTEPLANAIQNQVKAVGATVTKYIMEDLGPRPDDGSNPLPFPDAVGEVMKKAQCSFYLAQGKTGELKSFRIPMTNVATEHKLRHAHMPNFIEEMMGTGMAADYAKIQEISAKVYDIVKNAKEIRVTTPGGTDVTAKFSQEFKWIISDGNIQPGHWSNLPDGEVFTAPIDAWGKVVVDGCLGDFFNQKYGNLYETPLTYEVKDGRAIKESVTCNNEELKKEFLEYTFNTDENSNRMGEFAIGTNVGLKKLIGNLLQDEKFPGIHIALGNPYPEKTGVKWSSDAHNDGILLKPTIYVDGKTIMTDGEFTI